MPIAAAGDFDCLITDVRCRGSTASSCSNGCARVAPAMPVIFITSVTDEAARAAAPWRAGRTAWFAKPVADEALLGALRAALDGTRAVDARQARGLRGG